MAVSRSKLLSPAMPSVMIGEGRKGLNHVKIILFLVLFRSFTLGVSF